MKPDDINPEPIDHLLRFGSSNLNVQVFIDKYLRPLQSQRHGGKIEIQRTGTRWEHSLYWVLNTKPPIDKPKVDDPTLLLNRLLHEVMKTGNAQVRLDPRIVYGFSNVGRGFYPTFLYALNKQSLLNGDHRYPSPMIIEGASGLYCARPPDSPKEQMYHFLFHLKMTMDYLAKFPIDKRSKISVADIARDLTLLPKRAAYVRSGTDVGVIYTDDSLKGLEGDELFGRFCLIQHFTRQKYCKQQEEVETMGTTAKDAQVMDNQSQDVPDTEPPVSRWEEVE